MTTTHDDTATVAPAHRLPPEKNGKRTNGAAAPAQQTNGKANGKAAAPKRTMADVYTGLVGKAVTVATTDHLEDAPVGRRLHPGSYRAKVIGLGADHLVLATEYVHGGRSAGTEPMKQFVPLANIKRVSAMKSELILHL